jgi:hypothetical protein
LNNADFKRLVEIDNKMLNDKYITDKEIKERQDILKRYADSEVLEGK